MIWKLVVVAVGFAIGIAAGESTWIDTGIEEGGTQQQRWKEALQSAVGDHNNLTSTGNDNTYLRQVSRVIRLQIQTQDVIGTNYRFTVEMGHNTCLDGTTGERIDSVDCMVLPDDLQLIQLYKCMFTVWSQPSSGSDSAPEPSSDLPELTLTSHSCDEASK